MLKGIKTRFRAYQLGSAGSSFSYFADNHFTLLEARITDTSDTSVRSELEICGKTTIDTLHITSWDQDHCALADLKRILEEFSPRKIEYPGYDPHTASADNCLAEILRYDWERRNNKYDITVTRIDPPYVNSLKSASDVGYKDVFFHPKELDQNSSNNNSTVKLFRRGSFNVASLGDIESPQIGSMLRRGKIFSNEVDVLILAHHGSDNGVTTKTFLEKVKPTIAICSSNYDNQYDHPSKNIRDLLHEQEIKLFTTKTGDVVIKSIAAHFVKYKVTNYKANSAEISSEYVHDSKKSVLLSMNADTIRNRYHPGFKGPKR